jgi:excisionase family DNA binding protein
MALRDSLAAIVASCPPDATVPVRWLGELLAADGNASSGAPAAADATVDLSVAEVAARFRKGPSTVRSWCQAGELPGAYQLHGKQWRIPLAAIDAMQRAQASAFAARVAVKPSRTDDLGAWRQHVPRKAS